MRYSAPSLALSRLRAAFSVTWDLNKRPAYEVKVRHQFDLGGYDLKNGPSVDLDPLGLEWMRTIELIHRTNGIGYRMLVFEDLNVIIPGFPGPSPEKLQEMYG